ncbi:hypothetical protein VTI74DRAFT_11118 [Chaetomium olivicolor]
MVSHSEKDRGNGSGEREPSAPLSVRIPDAQGEAKKEEDDAWGAYFRIFRYAGTFEYTLQGIAVVAAIASGAGIALQNLIFGEFVTVITNHVSGLSFRDVFLDDAARLAFVLSYVYNTFLTYAGYRIVRNIRHAYVRSALGQEVAYYDFGIGGSIATQATSNGRLIQGGISEKLGLTFQGVGSLCHGLHPTIIVMAVVSFIEAGIETKILEVYARANSFAEGVHMLARGEIDTSGKIYTCGTPSVVIAFSNITMLAPYSIEFTRAATAAAQLFKLIDRASAIDPFDQCGGKPSEVTGLVELENITFSYPTRPGIAVLENFSLTVPAGKVTALVGQSGSGKSTIIGLLERWYNPSSGTIKLDGRPIDQLNLNWLRKNVRLVQQEPVSFQGSVFDNIAKGLEATKIAFVHDFISELPNGYDTEIGQRGGLLSGGQKQRIAIARSIVSPPKVLLLDEATNALDPHAEGVAQQALDRASKGRTTIIIAHKLATIRKADNIVVMSKGRIIEQGTHEGLVAQDGTYTLLLEDATSNEDGPPLEMTKTMTRYATTDLARIEAQKERDTFDGHQHLGLTRVILRLIQYTPELKWWYLLVLTSCFGVAAVFPGQAILLSRMMDVFTLTGEAMTGRGDFFASMFIVIVAGCLVFYFTMGWSVNVVAQTLSHKLRKQTFNDMLRQDLQFFDRRENNTDALASRVDSNPQSVFELMGLNEALILIAVLNVATCSILGLAHSWKLGLAIVFGGLPPLITAGRLKIRLDMKLDNTVSKNNSTSASIASEAITAIRTVSSLAIEDRVLGRYTAELDHAVAGTVKPIAGAMVCFALTQSIEYWFLALGFWYGCRLVAFNEKSMHDFFVAFMGVFFSGQATAQLFQLSTSITKGKNSANYIFWLSELPPIIKKGQLVAVVGASGCGKSTVIAMLERFYDLSTGNIRIDGDVLSELNPRLYRSIVSLVQQEPTLFKGTIRENIALEIRAALRAANAWDFVSSLPDGLSTAAGSNGMQLSGGQRQRIAIAPALVRHPQILLLDEATSALDTESEKIVQSALAEAAKKGDRITVAVVHRLSTFKDADLIRVFHGGRIIEKGTHEELIAFGGMYRMMCEAQNLD